MSQGELQCVRDVDELARVNMEVDCSENGITKVNVERKSWAQEVEDSIQGDYATPSNECEVSRPPPTSAVHGPSVSTTPSYASVVKEVPVPTNNLPGNYYLPPNHDWSKYIFAKCHTRDRPIYVTEILAALTKAIDTKHVISLGPYRSTDVYLLELNSVQLVSQLLQCNTIKVGGAAVEFFPTVDNQVAITLVNVPHAVSQIEVEQAISPFGVVQRHYHLYCPDPRFSHVIINRRRIIVKLHANTVIDNIPQALVIASFRVPLFVAGRQPKCNGCGQTGHMLNLCPQISQRIRDTNLGKKEVTLPDGNKVVRRETIEPSSLTHTVVAKNSGLTAEIDVIETVASIDTQQTIEVPLSSLSHNTQIQVEGVTNNTCEKNSVAEVCAVALLKSDSQNESIVRETKVSIQQKRKSENQENQKQSVSRSSPPDPQHENKSVPAGVTRGAANTQEVLKKPKRQQKKKKTQQGQREKSRSPIALRRGQIAASGTEVLVTAYDALSDSSEGLGFDGIERESETTNALESRNDVEQTD